MRDLDAPARQLLAVGQRRPDQVLDPARAACTAAVPISVSRGICAGSQKLVTTKAPCAPSSAERRVLGSSRSALATSTPRAANARAASLAGLRLATRTAKLGDAAAAKGAAAWQAARNAKWLWSARLIRWYRFDRLAMCSVC